MFGEIKSLQQLKKKIKTSQASQAVQSTLDTWIM